jgi:hypothetical protein
VNCCFRFAEEAEFNAVPKAMENVECAAYEDVGITMLDFL